MRRVRVNMAWGEEGGDGGMPSEKGYVYLMRV